MSEAEPSQVSTANKDKLSGSPSPKRPKPVTPKRRDSFNRYQDFTSKYRNQESLSNVSHEGNEKDLFSSSDDDEIEEVDAGKRAPLRSVAMVKKDILSSEETYVYCLSLIVDGYLAELEGNPHKPDFIIERKASIFGNISEVYNLHKKLLDVLRKDTGTDEMCRGFLQLEEEFQAYTEYLKTVSTGWKALAAFGGSFFDDVKRQRRLGYSLVDCYNRTFVRLKQYCDLFKELLGGAQKEELHSVIVIQKTLSMLTGVRKQSSNIVALGNLRGTPVGILPEEGVLDVDDFLVTIVHKKKKKKERLTVFLHSNCVLLAVKEKKDEIHPPIYVYQEHLLCSNLTLSKEFKGKHKFALSDGPIATSDTVYVLQHVEEEDTMAVKDKWTSIIENLLMKQFEALKEKKGGTHQDLPPPIVHVVNLPSDRSPRTSHGSKVGSKHVSKVTSTVSEGSRKSEPKVVTSPKIVTEKEEAPGIEVFEVHCDYTASSKEVLQLPIGQLVEVLDQSGVNWLVCTVSSNGDHEPVEGFVPSKCLRPHKSDRPLSIASHYSVSDPGGSDRMSRISHGSQGGGVSLQHPRSRPTSTTSANRSPHTSRPPSGVSNRGSEVPVHPPTNVAVSAPLHQPSVIAEDILWYAVEEYTGEGGFHLVAGEAVEVLDTSGLRWYVCTVNDPQEGYVPPQFLSQMPSTPQIETQPSVVEAKTPTGTGDYSFNPQDSFESVTTPSTAGESASLGGVSGVLRDTLEEVTGGRRVDKTELTSQQMHTHTPQPISQAPVVDTVRDQYQKVPEDSFEDVTPSGDPGTAGYLFSGVENMPPKETRKLVRALADFSGSGDFGIPFKEGQIFEVLDDSGQDWWLVVPVGGGGEQQQGWAPANHLEPIPDMPSKNPVASETEDDDPPPSDHESEPSTPTQPEPETPDIVAATEPLEESLTNPLEKSLTRSQIERQKPKPPKIFVSKAHVMAGDDKEISLYLGQKVEILDDSTDDWWLVKTFEESSKNQGWVPSKALDLFVPTPLEQSVELQASSTTKKYLTTTSDFTGDADSIQLTVGKGEVVEVIDESNEYWTWVCTVHSTPPQEGWLPRDILQ